MWVLNLIKSHKPVFFADFCAFTLCCRIIYKLSCFSHWFEAHTQDNPILANGKGKGVARIPAGTAKCFYLFLCTYTSLSSAWAPDTTGEDMFPLLKVCDLKSCFPINPVAEEQKAREREGGSDSKLAPGLWLVGLAISDSSHHLSEIFLEKSKRQM